MKNIKNLGEMEKAEIANLIFNMIQEIPNDMELGRKIRALHYDYKKSLANTEKLENE